MTKNMIDKIYTIPKGERVYAVGDIHGYADVVKRLVDRIMQDWQKNPADKGTLIFLGDYVDRGPDSKGVIDFMIEIKEEKLPFKTIFLRGNHENAMYDFLYPGQLNFGDHDVWQEWGGKSWLTWGGVETAESYGVKKEGLIKLVKNIISGKDIRTELIEKMLDKHTSFIESLGVSHQVGDYFFAHAGVNPDVPFHEQNFRDLTFIREPFLSWDTPLEYKVVHGHTIEDAVSIKTHRIGIDTGLYNGGPLTCAVLEDEDIRFIQEYA